MHEPSSRRAKRRQALRTILEQRDLSALSALAHTERNLFTFLLAFLATEEPLLAWRAIEALGHLIAAQPSAATEKIRDLLRRLFWSMNDESGNLLRHAPEAIGEILYNAPSLLDEYAPILPSFFHEEPFERGTYWAVARIATKQPACYAHQRDALLEALTDADPMIRAYALLALQAIGALHAIPPHQQQTLLDDSSPLLLYHFDSGQLLPSTFQRLLTGQAHTPNNDSPGSLGRS